VQDVFRLTADELRAVSTATLPDRLGATITETVG